MLRSYLLPSAKKIEDSLTRDHPVDEVLRQVWLKLRRVEAVAEVGREHEAFRSYYLCWIRWNGVRDSQGNNRTVLPQASTECLLMKIPIRSAGAIAKRTV